MFVNPTFNRSSELDNSKEIPNKRFDNYTYNFILFQITEEIIH